MSKHIYVGVDWHKRTSTWVAINEERESVYSREWGCTPDDVQAAITSLPATPADISLGVEPVCGWRWMTQACMDRGIKDTQVANPRRLREIAQTAKKTDKNDALTIAELLRMGYLPRAYRAPDDIQDLRMLVRQRGFFVRLSTATKCRIHGVCTALGEHVTAERPLLVAGKAAVFKSGHAELRDLYTMVDELNVHKKDTEKRILKHINKTHLYHIVSSMPGVGQVTASAIIAEVGDFARFKSPSSLVGYTGLYPRERSSGGKQQFGGISKVGSRVLRYSIIEAAMRIRDTETSHNLYTHYDAAKNRRKKTPKQARVVLAHKMLTIMWYLVKQDTLYSDHMVKPAQREMIP